MLIRLTLAVARLSKKGFSKGYNKDAKSIISFTQMIKPNVSACAFQKIHQVIHLT